MCFSPRLVDSRKKRWSVEKMSVKTNAHTIDLRIHIIVLSYISQKSFFSCCRYYLGVSGSNLFSSFVFRFSFYFLFSPSARSIFNLSIKKYGKKNCAFLTFVFWNFKSPCSIFLQHNFEKPRREKDEKKPKQNTCNLFSQCSFFRRIWKKKKLKTAWIKVEHSYSVIFARLWYGFVDSSNHQRECCCCFS